ncbi:MAG: membrane dipeptidase [candidate division Zixibacteria bacterium]|nr:membrane dipeptidase [candidate division Zixibacteria bacterium]
MLITDAHLDLSWNAIQGNRNLLYSVYTIRTQEKGQSGQGRALGTVALPEMRKGRIALSVVTLFGRSTGNPTPHTDYGSPTQAYGAAQGQLAYYRALQREKHVRLLVDAVGLGYHIAEWEAWDRQGDGEPPPLGFVISMEGADPILEPAQLEEWYEGGLRLLGLTHYGLGRYAGGTGVEDGLTPLGPPLLREMQRLGVLLDLTHSSDRSFWESLEHYDGPVLASHNNCRALVPHQRQFDDDQLRAVIERGGVIGAAFDDWMLYPGWTLKSPGNRAVSLSRVVDHIDHVCQLAGNARHAGIGSDLDGGFGREQSPHDLDTIADEQKIAGLLSSRGYKDDDVTAIMCGNWVRLLQKAWEG